MVIAKLFLGQNHRLGWQAIKANSPRLRMTPLGNATLFHVDEVVKDICGEHYLPVGEGRRGGRRAGVSRIAADAG
jgi:hypothetical protein